MRKTHEKFTKRRFWGLALGVLAGVLVGPALALAAPPSRFSVRFSDGVRPEPFSGRVYLFFAPAGEPRRGPNWFRPAPMLAREVESLRPGEAVELVVGSGDAAGRPAGTAAFPKGLKPESLVGLKAQAVIRFNPVEREVGTGAGNGFSEVVDVPADGEALDLLVDQIVPPTPVEETEWTKILRVPSPLLSEFHGRPVEVAGAVQLPPSYFSSPDRRYPVVFEIPGFGGGLKHGVSKAPYAPETAGGVEFLHVLLDPNCPLGHHVFADSANNGPVGRALVDEFIPALDRQFRTAGSPAGRFLTGHSSGGWSSLWLQVTYPEVFNGTWSTAPDPVDFRDFQRINLYRAGENMYVDPRGERRPLGRIRGQAAIWYDDFALMEDVLGPGGQLHSFEAVFSRRGTDGRPELLWNRETGAVDQAVAESWKRYDIRLILEQNWTSLGPKLSGKLHVYMGDQDTFYLEGATELLKESLEKLGSDTVVEIHPGADHSTLMTKELRARIPREMSERYLRTVGR